MGMYVEVKQESQTDQTIIYKYRGDFNDWGIFSVKKNSLEFSIIQRAESDPNNEYVYRAYSAVKRDFNNDGVFPLKTCFAS